VVRAPGRVFLAKVQPADYRVALADGTVDDGDFVPVGLAIDYGNEILARLERRDAVGTDLNSIFLSPRFNVVEIDRKEASRSIGRVGCDYLPAG